MIYFSHEQTSMHGVVDRHNDLVFSGPVLAAS